jgi:hypothetical protein
MNHRELLQRLIRIERAVGVETNLTIQKMIMDVQTCLLAQEKARVEHLQHTANQPPPDEWESFELEALEARIGANKG